MASNHIAIFSAAQASQPGIGVFQELFEQSLKLFQDKYPNDRFNTQNGCTLHDLHQAVLHAKAQYDGHLKEHKARRWLTRFSKRVTLYGNILDTFVQHHPEYVALAWGTFKLIFQLVMNHEEMVSELSKAMCKIAEVLPRAELKAVTYATDDMKRLIESLLSSIIEFFSRVIGWYEENRAKHAFNALWRPFRLRFQDLCDEIDEGARRIDKLAEALMQAEIRELLTVTRSMYLEQTTMNSVLAELKQIVLANNAINAPLILNTHQNTCRIQLAQILKAVSMNYLPDPAIALQYSSSLRKRRSRLQGPARLLATLPTTHETKLSQWLTSPEPSLLHLKGVLKTKDSTRDTATGMVELLVNMKYPVLWVMRGRETIDLGENGLVQLIKHLIWQALRLDAAAVSSISTDFNSAIIQSACSEDEWFQILQMVLRRFKHIFIVVDVEVVKSGPEADPIFSTALYTRLLEFLEACKPTVVKILLSSYRKHSSAIITDALNNDATSACTILNIASSRHNTRRLPGTQKDIFSALRTRLEQANLVSPLDYCLAAPTPAP